MFKMFDDEVRAEILAHGIRVVSEWTLQQVHSSTDWDASTISDDQRFATLRTLCQCAQMSQGFGGFLHNTPEFAALRLAEADVAATPIRRRAYRQESMLNAFDANLASLCRSWTLQHPMAERLRTCALGDYSISELQELRVCLTAGWPQEYVVEHRAGNDQNLSVWVTPEQRW